MARALALSLPGHIRTWVKHLSMQAAEATDSHAHNAFVQNAGKRSHTKKTSESKVSRYVARSTAWAIND